MLIASTFLVTLAHGSNDVGNAISPLVYLFKLDSPKTATYVPFLLGSIGIAFGLLAFGKNVMETIGEKVIKLDYMQAFVVQFSAAICICLGSSLGIPLSTTHCVIGALVGLYFAKMTSTMDQIYRISERAE